MNAVAEPLADPSPIAFGSLIDLAMLRLGTTAEICDACNTINLGSARWCKCCSHKLPAFYIAKGLKPARRQPPRRRSRCRGGCGPWTSLPSGS